MELNNYCNFFFLVIFWKLFRWKDENSRKGIQFQNVKEARENITQVIQNLQNILGKVNSHDFLPDSLIYPHPNFLREKKSKKNLKKFSNWGGRRIHLHLEEEILQFSSEKFSENSKNISETSKFRLNYLSVFFPLKNLPAAETGGEEGIKDDEEENQILPRKNNYVVHNNYGTEELHSQHRSLLQTGKFLGEFIELFWEFMQEKNLITTQQFHAMFTAFEKNFAGKKNREAEKLLENSQRTCFHLLSILTWVGLLVFSE
jgi:hypothetical protein